VLRKWGRGRPSRDEVDVLRVLAEPRIKYPISRWERTVQELRPDLQEIVGSLRTPAHLLSLAHSVIDEVIHDRFHMSCRDAAPFSTRLGKVRHATSIAADVSPKFSDEPEDLVHRRPAALGVLTSPGFNVTLQEIKLRLRLVGSTLHRASRIKLTRFSLGFEASGLDRYSAYVTGNRTAFFRRSKRIPIWNQSS
jgi:hypothetical protein